MPLQLRRIDAKRTEGFDDEIGRRAPGLLGLVYRAKRRRRKLPHGLVSTKHGHRTSFNIAACPATGSTELVPRDLLYTTTRGISIALYRSVRSFAPPTGRANGPGPTAAINDRGQRSRLRCPRPVSADCPAAISSPAPAAWATSVRSASR